MIIRYRGQEYYVVRGAKPSDDMNVPFADFLNERDAQLEWCKDTLGPRGKRWRYQMVTVPRYKYRKFKTRKSNFFMFENVEDLVAFKLRWA